MTAQEDGPDARCVTLFALWIVAYGKENPFGLGKRNFDEITTETLWETIIWRNDKFYNITKLIILENKNLICILSE